MRAAFTATRPVQGGNGQGASGECGRACLHETSDHYTRVVAVSNRWRAIWCKDDRWFTLQKRRGRTKKRPWQGLVCQRKQIELGSILERPGTGIPPAGLATLMARLDTRGVVSAMGGPRHD